MLLSLRSVAAATYPAPNAFPDCRMCATTRQAYPDSQSEKYSFRPAFRPRAGVGNRPRCPYAVSLRLLRFRPRGAFNISL
jgi:hypothetical protein